MRATLLTVILLLCVVPAAAQSIHYPPHLEEQQAEGSTVTTGLLAYYHRCPFCGAETCWLLWDRTNVDDYPDYVDSDGYRHWHDTTYSTSRWLCDCGHVFVEYADNGPCWCGWHQGPSWYPDPDGDTDSDEGGPDGQNRR